MLSQAFSDTYKYAKNKISYSSSVVSYIEKNQYPKDGNLGNLTPIDVGVSMFLAINLTAFATTLLLLIVSASILLGFIVITTCSLITIQRYDKYPVYAMFI